MSCPVSSGVRTFGGTGLGHHVGLQKANPNSALDEDDNYDTPVLQQDYEVGDNMGAVAVDAFLGDGDTAEDGDLSEGEDVAAHPANPTRRTWTRSLRCVIVSWVRLLPCPVRAPNVALLKEVRVSDEDMVEVVACLARPSSFSAGVECLACTRPAES